MLAKKKYNFIGSPLEKFIFEDGIVLRPCQPSDASDMFDTVENNREELKPWLEWVNTTTGETDSLNFINKSMDDWLAGEIATYGIFINDRYAGSINAIAREGNTAEIGYWLDKQSTGRGIMTRLAEAMTESAINDLKVDRVIIRADVRNESSWAIPERLGFNRKGESKVEERQLYEYEKLKS